MIPQRLENAGLHPLLKAIVGRGSGTKAGGVQCFPLAAGAEDEEDGFHTDAVGGTWASAAEAMGVGMFGEQGGDGLPEIIGDAPIVECLGKGHDFVSFGVSCQENKCSCTKALYPSKGYSDRL